MTKENQITGEKREFKDVYDVLGYIVKNLSVPKTRYNKFGGYYSRSCEDIYDGVKKILPDGANLRVTDTIALIGDRYYVEAVAELSFKGGVILNNGYAREEESKKGMDGSQVTGAASSYARKYALNGLFLIDDVKDSDETNEHGKVGKDAGKDDEIPKDFKAPEKVERPPEVIMPSPEWTALQKRLRGALDMTELQTVFKEVQSKSGAMSKAQLTALIKEKDKTKEAIGKMNVQP